MHVGLKQNFDSDGNTYLAWIDGTAYNEDYFITDSLIESTANRGLQLHKGTTI